VTLRRIATRPTLPEDQGTVAWVGDTPIALFRAGDGVYAYPNACPHKGGPVGEGLVVDGIVTCPWHGSQFDIMTGECVSGPAEGPLEPILVDLQGDDVLIDVHP
jgi:nitrite reductase/ring-hydroxylating ferredoxin subunit